MRCEKMRARLHGWLDQPSASSLPAELADHVRECGNCRAFVKQWNSIEIQLQTMRHDGPQPSPGFREALKVRLQSPPERQPFRLPSFNMRPVLTYASILLVALALLSAVFGPRLLNHGGSKGLASGNSARPVDTSPGAGLANDLPIGEIRH